MNDTYEITIARLREENRRIIEDAKKELRAKDTIIKTAIEEATRLYDPTRKYWNEELGKEIQKRDELLKQAIPWVERNKGNANTFQSNEEFEKQEQWLREVEGLGVK